MAFIGAFPYGGYGYGGYGYGGLYGGYGGLSHSFKIVAYIYLIK